MYIYFSSLCDQFFLKLDESVASFFFSLCAVFFLEHFLFDAVSQLVPAHLQSLHFYILFSCATSKYTQQN